MDTEDECRVDASRVWSHSLQESKATAWGVPQQDCGISFSRLQSYNEECLIHNAALS